MFENIESFLEVLPGKLVCADKNHYIKASNLGKEYNDLIIFDILEESETDEFKKQLEYAKASKSSCEYVTFKEKPFKKCYKNTIKPSFDSVGRLDGYSLYQEDITEKYLLEQRILETQFIYYEAFKSIGVGVWEYNRELKIFNISNTLKKMLNLNTNVITLEKWEKLVYPEDWKRIQNELNTIIRNKSDILLVNIYRIRINPDKFIWVNSTGKIIKYDKEGFPIKSLGIIQDITSQVEAKENLKKYNKQLEEEVKKRTKELNLAKKEAEQANMAKSEFLSNISHEFFTPLNIILNSASIIERKLNNEDVKKILRNIKKSGESLNSLVKNMLFLAKLDLNNIKFKFYKTDIISLLNSLILEIRNKFDISVKTEISTPIRYIYCDSMNIKMVLLELINNSIKHSDGKPDILVKIFNDDNYIVFKIIDNGTGVKHHELKEMFTRFYTGSNSRNKITEKGLGLSICKEIINKHKGEIWAENNTESGLIVTFTLPILGEKDVS